MDALLEKYGGDVKPLKRGDKVKGKVIGKSRRRLILDIDRKSEGLVAEKAFNEARDFIKKLEVGDELTASVIIPETPEGYTVLSLRETQQEAAWETIEKAKSNKTPIVVLGKATNPAGVMVDVEGMTGFIPNSQLGKEVLGNPKELVGEHFKAQVIETDRSSNKIVLSEREVSEAEDIKLIKKAIKNMKEGDLFEGKITTIADFGCFVSVKAPVGKSSKKKVEVEGLIHISQLSWDKIENIRDRFKEGDKVKVRLIGINGRKLAFSVKQAQEDPWDKADKKYKADSKHKGKVVRVSDFGAFVELEPGIEGLIHLTKIPPGKKLEKGQEVNVYVEEIDTKQKKLSLGLVLTAKPVGYK